jgi:hypothetical protein
MSDNLAMVRSWYEHFDKQDLNYIVSSFADDAIVIVGDGDSEGAVPYGGRFVGIQQIKHYYAGRFMKAGASSFVTLRPFCGITAPGVVFQQFGRWVIVGAKITDTHADRSPIYHGDFLHVWSINPNDHKVASLSMYFDTGVIR